MVDEIGSFNATEAHGVIVVNRKYDKTKYKNLD